MKKISISLLSALFLSLTSFGPLPAQAEFNDNKAEVQDVELTEEQKQELGALHKEALEKKKEIIEKYVEFGVFTEEKGDKIIKKFESHYKKLEDNGYIPKWDHKRKHH
ncbi:YckD family protein [Alkalihalobacterium elongatum]|uniref:YckD family protein n=1 Tax=Alkalihalobacterium elongatum TaxID=2675466 RepID=UPI001C1F9543|nr:YckD family protein [Alkalihalobacterium elongatum]